MENVTTSRLSPVPGLVIGGILLLVAVLRMPYGYYVFMRWFVTAACVYGAWFASENGKDVWTWLLGAVAVLFNPILAVDQYDHQLPELRKSQPYPGPTEGGRLLHVPCLSRHDL